MLILQKNLQIYFLITFCTCYNIIDQHSKNQKPKQIWKLFLLPPWKEFQQKNWKFWKQKQELWGDNRQWKRLLQCEVKWSEVKWHLYLKRVNTWQFWPKLINLLPSVNIKSIIILQCHYKKIKIYIYEKILTI